MKVKIKTVCKELPKYSKTTVEIMPFLDAWLGGQEPQFIRKVKKIFEGAGVEKRYSFMEPLEVLTITSFEERNSIYVREVIDYGEKVLKKALVKANWNPEDLDYIITVSCTGWMIPSLDAYLINKLKLRQDIVRLPVTEMGCSAGVSGILYAKNFLKANPGKRAAVIAVESPMASFQLKDFSMANMISAAFFGDGAACVLLSSCEEEEGPEILAEEMYHFYDEIDMVGMKLSNAGWQMVLDPEVANLITTHFPEIIHPFLAKNKLTIENINHLIFHPGAKKIVQTVEDLLSNFGKNINDSKEVMKSYGNMSSATVLYVLERIMESNPQKGELGLMLSFGPGFSAQSVLLRF